MAGCNVIACIKYIIKVNVSVPGGCEGETPTVGRVNVILPSFFGWGLQYHTLFACSLITQDNVCVMSATLCSLIVDSFCA